MFGMHDAVKLVHIPHQILRASFSEVTERAPLGYRFPMPQMIIQRNHESRAGHIVSEVHVKHAVLGHAVGYLEHTASILFFSRLDHPHEDPLVTGTGIKRNILLDQIQADLLLSSSDGLLSFR